MSEPSSGVTIGILSPGAMGGALGRAWQAGGARAVTTVAGRSARTRALAEGLDLLDSLEAVVAAADIVVSVVPPAQVIPNAEQIAAAAGATGVRPVVADLNAVSLPTMDRVAEILTAAGCPVVDGSISGMPPTGSGAGTRVYLSGERAAELTRFDSGDLTSTVVGAEVGQASAIKMCTAAVYKGLTALMIQSLRTADTHGVSDLVVADWQAMMGITDAPQRIALATAKSDRFPDEMREIAATQEAAGYGAELYEAIARVFEGAYATELGTLSPEQATAITALPDLLARLRAPRPAD
ncbi:DUF1932 domain-containing protein [Granulicoccus phenolivorans]|uniref:DUF1932 domain-containing protein n=1 Tax=Granulicoccus phenolivorans TaxID=266854 RepID=UPI0003FB0FC2|nr:NAD(P)-dependent oxidoreductase [Granulicoccus phenolivorans]